MKSRGLNPGERRFWILHNLYDGSPAYHVGHSLRIQGSLDREILRQALLELTRRFESLRVTYPDFRGEPRAVTHSDPAISLGFENLESEEHALRAAQGRLKARFLEPFDLAERPLVRFDLWALAKHDHLLAWVGHHIVVDGWSVVAMGARLGEIYRSLQLGASLPAHAPCFALVAGKRWSGMAEGEQARLNWWRHHLDTPIPPFCLPSDRVRPQRRSLSGSRRLLDVPREIVDTVIERGRGVGVSPYQTLLAAFSGWLSRLTGRSDIPLLIPVGNRQSEEERRVLGSMVNTMLLRIRLDRSSSLIEHSLAVQEVIRGALENQLPFERILEEIGISGPEAPIPTTSHLFQLPIRPSPLWEVEGLKVESIPVMDQGSKLDLSIDVTELAPCYRWDFEWSRDLFSESNQERFESLLVPYLEVLANDPDQDLQTVNLVGLKGRRHLAFLEEGAPAKSDGKNVLDLISARARESPESPAVIDGDRILNRSQLSEKVRSLAAWLRKQGITSGAEVGICLPRSIESIVATLAVMKMGSVFQGFDPASPPAWIHSRLGSRTLLTNSEMAERWQASLEILVLDDVWAETHGDMHGCENPGGVAYVLTTSGSTGTPKRVEVSVEAARARIRWNENCLAHRDGERVLHRTSIQFVDAHEEVIGTLAHGAVVVVIDDIVTRDPSSLISLLRQHRVERCTLPPTMLRALLRVEPRLGERLPDLRYLISTGEPLSRSLAERILEAVPDARLFNQYGTSEAPHALFIEVESGEKESKVAVGRPTYGYRARIVDREGQSLAAGSAGEIELSGEAVASGYQRTGHSAVLLGGVFRTGDLGFWNLDGQITLIGRLDRQINHRGVRLDPHEIENIFREQDAVQDAVLTILDDGRLAALLEVREPSRDLTTILGSVREQLPPSAIPLVVESCSSLPRRGNGKIDLIACAERIGSQRTHSRERASSKALTPVRAIANRIWASLLDSYPDERGFVESGGDSLLAIRLCHELQRELGIPVSTSLLYESASGLEFVELLSALTLDVIGDEGRKLEVLRKGLDPQGPSLVLVPGAGGLALGLRVLTEQMRWHGRIFGFEFPGLRPGERPLRSVKGLASELIYQLDQLPIGDRLVLGGFSFGGLVAFEVAHQLRKSGRSVLGLLILDGFPPHLGYLIRTVVARRWRNLGRRIGISKGSLQPSLLDQTDFPRLLTPIQKACKWARWSYLPRAKFEGAMVLATTSELRAHLGDPGKAWSHFHEGPRLDLEFPGSHRELVRDERVEDVAKGVDKALSWIEGGDLRNRTD